VLSVLSSPTPHFTEGGSAEAAPETYAYGVQESGVRCQHDQEPHKRDEREQSDLPRRFGIRLLHAVEDLTLTALPFVYAASCSSDG
jgi:hypothetical protein